MRWNLQLFICERYNKLTTVESQYKFLRCISSLRKNMILICKSVLCNFILVWRNYILKIFQSKNVIELFRSKNWILNNFYFKKGQERQCLVYLSSRMTRDGCPIMVQLPRPDKVKAITRVAVALSRKIFLSWYCACAHSSRVRRKFTT